MARSRRLREATTVMFTTPGSKVVFVCGRQLERMARQDRGYLSVLVIHEVLHTLGLGENPPSSNTITIRVANRCRITCWCEVPRAVWR